MFFFEFYFVDSLTMLTVAFVLFSLSICGIFLNRKNIIIILLAVEILLFAIDLILITFSVFLDDLVGQIFALFILTVAAAESAIGLAILVIFFKVRGTISVRYITNLKH